MDKKVLVIGNCQSAGYTYFLNLFCPDIRFEAFGVENISVPDRPAKIADLIARRDEYAAIITVPLSDQFFEISKEMIVESMSGVPVYFYTNVYFSGLTPDLTYIGDFSGRCVGPLGDYHSKIALYGFMSGLTEAQTLELYNTEFMERLGLFDEFERSKTRLVSLDSASSVPICDFIFSNIKDELLFFSNNHPTTRIFFEYARRISQKLKSDGICDALDLPWSPLGYPNILSFSAIFPVYPEVSERLNLSYSTGYFYKPPEKPIMYSLEALVIKEFEAFTNFGRAALSKMPQWGEIEKFISNRSGRETEISAEDYIARIGELLSSGRPEAAEELANEAISIFPDHVWLATKHAESLNAQVKWKEAVASWSRIMSRFPQHAPGYGGCADAYLGLGDVKGAEAALQTAIDNCDQQFWIWVRYAQLAEKRTEMRLAYERWRMACKYFPEESFPFRRMAEIAKQEHNHWDSFFIASYALKKWPEDENLLLILLETSIQTGLDNDVFNLWRRCKGIVGDSDRFYYITRDLILNYISKSDVSDLIDSILDEDENASRNWFPRSAHFLILTTNTEDSASIKEAFVARIKSRTSSRIRSISEEVAWCLLGQPLDRADVDRNIDVCLNKDRPFIERFLLANWHMDRRLAEYEAGLDRVVGKIKRNEKELSYFNLYQLLKISSVYSKGVYLFLCKEYRRFTGGEELLGIESIVENSLSGVRSNVKGKKHLKIALCVSGQMRGFRTAFPSWRQMNIKNASIDVFVHTWKNIGMKPPLINDAGRSFHKNFADAYFEEVSLIGLEKMSHRYPSLLSYFDNGVPVSAEEIANIFNPVDMVIEDENHDGSKGKSNSWKMHYKIKSCDDLARSHGDYDIFVRMRPDKPLKAIDMSSLHEMLNASLSDEIIFTDEGRRFMQTVGFFIGDQFAMGSSSAMKKYASTFDVMEGTCLTSDFYGLERVHAPHSSLAQATFYQGVKVAEVKGIEFGGLENPDRLKPQLVVDLIMADAAERMDEMDLRILKAAKEDLGGLN